MAHSPNKVTSDTATTSAPTLPNAQSAPQQSPLKDILDFSFAEVSADEEQLIQTGGTCCSCS